MQGAGGLVGEQDDRVGDQGPGDGGTLLLSSGGLSRTAAHGVRQPDGGEQLLSPLDRAAPLPGVAVVEARQGHVLQECQMRQEVDLLEDESDSASDRGQLSLTELVDPRVPERDPPRRGPVDSAQAVQERRLACP